METSPEIAALAEALAKAQGLLKPAEKDAINPAYRGGYKYSDLAAVWAAWREVGPACGLATVQDVTTSPDGVAVLTRIFHTSGQWMQCGPIVIPLEKPGAHGIGSATSYAKRYGLGATLGIVSEDDDDGNAAAGVNGGARRFPEPQPVKPYYRGKPPESTRPAEEIGRPPVEPQMSDLALKDISEELLPHTDAAADDRKFLEMGVKRWADKHSLSTNERAALQVSLLKGKTVNKAAAEDLNKLYLLLNDPEAVKSWREEARRKLEPQP